MKLRLQADADFNQRIVAGVLRLEPAIDLLSSNESSLAGRPDPEVLTYCAEEQRTLLTHDQRTMPHHFATFLAQSSSPGVMIVPQLMPIGEAVHEIYRAWADSEAEDWVDSIRRLPL
ncbi:MAG TPA: DUF5615 family PIN-like protein [Chthoniobacteraceae bacterium]|jgi:hypothetical protein|nr:DUF5615 family PIN-like protein [Chthoniobacteraceae bacterium]